MGENIKKNILAALNGEYGEWHLPTVGTITEDGFAVIICPVCGSKTLDGYNICKRCGWEYDHLPFDHPSAANGGVTLQEYKEEFYKIKNSKTEN